MSAHWFVPHGAAASLHVQPTVEALVLFGNPARFAR
jgi:hypothetical protein